MADYRIGSRGSACAATGKPFSEGQVVVSAIYPDPAEGFVRRDFSEEGFADAPQAFSVWRAQVPVTPRDTQRLDFDLALTFYEKLLAEASEEHKGLLYVLTLLLARKRRVKIKQQDGELLTVVVPGPEDDREVSVTAPALDADAVVRLQDELAKLFGFGDSETADEPEPPESA